MLRQPSPRSPSPVASGQSPPQQEGAQQQQPAFSDPDKASYVATIAAAAQMRQDTIEVRPFLATNVVDAQQFIEGILTPQRLAAAIQAALPEVFQNIQQRLGQIVQEVQGIREDVQGVRQEVQELRQEVALNNAMSQNPRRRKFNSKAFGRTPWAPLFKVNPGLGPVLPPANGAPAFAIPAGVAVPVGQVVELFPANRESAFALTHDNLNMLAVHYNDSFGIVLGDSATTRVEKFVSWATVDRL